jgi:hypothetical protein
MDEGIKSYFLFLLVAFDEFGDDFADILHEENVLIDLIIIFFVELVGWFRSLIFVHQLYFLL